jgi:hypothetical protein
MTAPYAQEIAANLARAEESVQAAQVLMQQFSFWRSTGIDLRLELKPLDHEIHQVIPTIKHHITG